MARTVSEIMNRELLAVDPDLPAQDARDLLLSFAVGAAPVVDGDRRPLGVVSLRDVIEPGSTVRQRMTRPPLCVDASESIDSAARQLARTDVHHLVVVDGNGASVGMVSTLDLLRALLDMPTRHPAAFPHWDESTRVSWSDDWPLDLDSFMQAPDAPGVLALVAGHLGESDTVVWVETSAKLRARVLELVSLPAEQPPALVRVLSMHGLRFRVAAVPDAGHRAEVASVLRDRIEHLPPPGAP